MPGQLVADKFFDVFPSDGPEGCWHAAVVQEISKEPTGFQIFLDGSGGFILG